MLDTRYSRRGRRVRRLSAGLSMMVSLVVAAACTNPLPRPSGSPTATPGAPTATPGASGVMITGGRIDGHRSPDRPGPPAPAVPPEQEHETNAATPISDSTLTTHTSPPSGAAKVDAPPAGARSVDFSTYVPSTSGALINTQVPDISGADSPDGLAIHTGNRYADVIDGGNVTRIDPTQVFPAPLAGGLCCDQIITYVPSAEKFVWLMLHCPSDGCVKGAKG